MEHIEEEASTRGATALYLHTGSLQEDAIGLRDGNASPTSSPPYEDDGVSQCYVKELVPH